MHYQRLGSTGVQISRLGLGCGNFGGIGSAPAFFGMGEDEAQAAALLDRAWDAGINLLDTADAYGGGRSEQYIGRWLAARGSSVRDRLVVSSKVYNPAHACVQAEARADRQSGDACSARRQPRDAQRPARGCLACRHHAGVSPGLQRRLPDRARERPIRRARAATGIGRGGDVHPAACALDRLPQRRPAPRRGAARRWARGLRARPSAVGGRLLGPGQPGLELGDEVARQRRQFPVRRLGEVLLVELWPDS
jgi:hypothetical protein